MPRGSLLTRPSCAGKPWRVRWGQAHGGGVPSAPGRSRLAMVFGSRHEQQSHKVSQSVLQYQRQRAQADSASVHRRITAQPPHITQPCPADAPFPSSCYLCFSNGHPMAPFSDFLSASISNGLHIVTLRSALTACGPHNQHAHARMVTYHMQYLRWSSRLHRPGSSRGTSPGARRWHLRRSALHTPTLKQADRYSPRAAPFQETDVGIETTPPHKDNTGTGIGGVLRLEGGKEEAWKAHLPRRAGRCPGVTRYQIDGRWASWAWRQGAGLHPHVTTCVSLHAQRSLGSVASRVLFQQHGRSHTHTHTHTHN